MSAPQCVATIESVSRVPGSSTFQVQVVAGKIHRSLWLAADVLSSPTRFGRELLRELSWILEPCPRTVHGTWPTGRWNELLSSKMTSPNKKRAGRDERPTRQK